MALDFDARYTVDGYGGVAWRIAPKMIIETFDDGEPTGELTRDDDFVIATMIGDDRAFVIDVADLTMISDDDYCHQCGQIGCDHDGR